MIPPRPKLGFLKTLVLLPSTFAFWLALPAGAGVPEDHADIDSYVDASTCAECHDEDHHAEIMATSHWTWNHVDTISGQTLGKKNVINNYCVATPSNEPRCTSCHVGVGWRDNTFDFTDTSKVDCLVCHDTTGTYFKTPTGAGASGNLPGDNPGELNYIAQHAGTPVSRHNCGACHFYGGGGDAVKHGDLDSTMENPPRTLDVHMGTDGGKFTCVKCHEDKSTVGNKHDFVGTRYPTTTPDHMLCESCHTASPHMSSRLNTHTSRVACQTCHIPAFARGGKATKMTWDWTTAGNRMPDGSDRVINDADGNPIYHSKKGTFTWQENVIPPIRWFNGLVTFTTVDDTVLPGQMVTINQLHGSKSDSNARLFPVKRFTGKQPYDAGNQNLAVPHLFPYSPTDTTAYWKGYDWGAALAEGMNYIGKPFSGTVGYVETEMFWIENHMVAPKEDALHCSDCHAPNSRLDFRAAGYSSLEADNLQNFYGVVDVLGIVVVAPGATAELRWTSQVGYDYIVQSSPNMVNWVAEPGGEFSAGASPEEFVFTDNPAGGLPVKKYYRVLGNN